MSNLCSNVHCWVAHGIKQQQSEHDTQLHPLVLSTYSEQLSPVHPVLHSLPVHLKELDASHQDCEQGKVGVGTELEPTSNAQDHNRGILISCASY